jgi:hypothetical protein
MVNWLIAGLLSESNVLICCCEFCVFLFAEALILKRDDGCVLSFQNEWGGGDVVDIFIPVVYFKKQLPHSLHYKLYDSSPREYLHWFVRLNTRFQDASRSNPQLSRANICSKCTSHEEHPIGLRLPHNLFNGKFKDAGRSDNYQYSYWYSYRYAVRLSVRRLSRLGVTLLYQFVRHSPGQDVLLRRHCIRVTDQSSVSLGGSHSGMCERW